MTTQLKLKFDENEKQTKKYIRKYNDLYKIMTVCYGLLRCYIDLNNYRCEHDIILDELRGYLSEYLFKHLEDVDSDDE